MTKLTFGKTEARRLAKVLDPGYADLDGEQKAELEALASVALAEAADIVLSRASYTVVGQLRNGPDSRWTGPGEAEAARGCLGFFSTEGGAKEAAESLVYSSSTHETWSTWVLPVEHCTAAEFHKSRQLAKKAAAAKELAERYSRERLDAWAEQRAADIYAEIAALDPAERKAMEKRIGKAEWAAFERTTGRSQGA